MLVRNLDELHHVEAEQLHQGPDLLLGALPVLGREAIDGQVLHAETRTVGDGLLQRLTALLMAHGTWEALMLRPASIAIQYDGDMGRDVPALRIDDIH